MKAKELIKNHKIPCGPLSVGVDGMCRRRLHDHLDALLDQLTKDVHPGGIDDEILGLEEKVEIPEETEPEETDKEKKKRLISEGKLKAEVKHEVEKYKNKLMGNSKMLQDRSGKINKR